MPVSIQRDDGGALVVRGELDMASAPSLEAAATEAPMDGRLVLDLRDVTFIDSSGIRALVRVARACAPTRLVLRDPSARLEQLFRLVGIEDGRTWTIERSDAFRPSDGPGAWNRFAATIDLAARAVTQSRISVALHRESRRMVVATTAERLRRSRATIAATSERTDRTRATLLRSLDHLADVPASS